MSIIDAIDRASTLAVLWECGVYVLFLCGEYRIDRWCDAAPSAVVAVVTPHAVRWVW